MKACVTWGGETASSGNYDLGEKGEEVNFPVDAAKNAAKSVLEDVGADCADIFFAHWEQGNALDPSYQKSIKTSWKMKVSGR